MNRMCFCYFYHFTLALFRLKDSGFFAENCATESIILVAVGYTLAPKGVIKLLINFISMHRMCVWHITILRFLF